MGIRGGGFLIGGIGRVFRDKPSLNTMLFVALLASDSCPMHQRRDDCPRSVTSFWWFRGLHPHNEPSMPQLLSRSGKMWLHFYQ